MMNNSLMTLINKKHHLLNEDIKVIKLIPEANKQIIIINIYFALECSRRKKTLRDLNHILLKIHSKLNSFNHKITGDFNCNLDSHVI
jgi:hypothetical protein